MSRLLLLLTLVLLVPAGCLDASEDPSTPQGTSDDSSEDAPQPVFIDESIDLTTGEPGRDWHFTVHPGATRAVVRFAVEGLAGTDFAQETNWCFTLEGPKHKARDCGVPAGNVNVQITVFGAETFYSWSPAPAGTYDVHFDSAPAVGQFRAHVNVQYE